MPRTHNGSNGGDQQREEQGQSSTGEHQQDGSLDAATQWFAATAVRAGLTVIGVVLLLFALGQAVGLPLLELVTSALTSQTGQWLVVAFFAVLLIGVAQKAVPSG